MAISVCVVLTILFPDIVTRAYQADQATPNVKSGVINTMDAWPTTLPLLAVVWLHVEISHAQVVTHYTMTIMRSRQLMNSLADRTAVFMVVTESPKVYKKCDLTYTIFQTVQLPIAYDV